MTHIRHIFTLILSCLSLAANSQTPADSIAIHNTDNWETIHHDNTHKISRGNFPSLFGHPQNVTTIEAVHGSHTIGIGISDTLRLTSEIAQTHHAAIAVNGSYFDMTHGNSVSFLKENTRLIATTAPAETNRCNGAIRCVNRTLEILPWNPRTEQTYTDTIGTILAGGPLLIHAGTPQAPPEIPGTFTLSPHPRTAVGLTRQGNIILLTVDGRHPGNAQGMTIPQLTYLMRQLGCTDAINLDGGGSTTLWTAIHGILNHPSDNAAFDHQGQRPVPNILYLR